MVATTSGLSKALGLALVLCSVCSVAFASDTTTVVFESSEEGEGSGFKNLFVSVKGDVENMTVEVERLSGDGIPDWVHATKFNNGFGKYEGKGFAFNYLFDVMAYVAKWRIDGNKVSFSNKFVNSSYYQKSKESVPTFRTFGGVTPPMNTAEKLATLAHLLSDNLNVNIMKFGNHLVTLSDMAGQVEIDQLNLNTLGRLTFNDTLTSKFTLITCAHPSKLPGDPFIYNYHVHVMGNMPHIGKMNRWEFYRIDTSKGDTLSRELMLTVPIVNGKSPYMHSFAHTPNYIVTFEFPLEWDVMKIIISTNILPDLTWRPENGTHVKVIDKNTWKIVKSYYIEPVFAYHHVNAYEDDSGDVVVDITTVPCENSTGKASCEHMNAFELKTLRNNSWSIPSNVFKRFHVPVKGGGDKVTSEVLSKTSFDLPHINPKFVGHKHKYVYATGDHGEGVWWNTLVKVDVDTGETVTWYEKDQFPTEPNFIPRPGATDEDDGVLVSQVLGGDIGTSYLLVLDAKTMKPLAKVKAPHFLPYVSHGFSEADA
jgi:carotenoid cleavage dioxygenase-like enzyme